MKLIMENWRNFLNEGPIVVLPSGTSKEDRNYRKMIKWKPPSGLGSSANVIHSDDSFNSLSRSSFLKYINKLSKERPHPETLRNTVRFFVRKYCKNKSILELFEKLEKLQTSEVSKELVKLTSDDFTERWFSLSAPGLPLGSYGPDNPDVRGRRVPSIHIFDHAGWREWYGWDSIVEDLLPFIRTHVPPGQDPLRSRVEYRYEARVVRNFNRFLNIMRALWVSATYVHELAHATDPNKYPIEHKTTQGAPWEVYATSQAIVYIKNLKKGILKDIFGSELPGNFRSWGSSKTLVPGKGRMPFEPILNIENPRRALVQKIGSFLGWILENELAYRSESQPHSN